MRRIATIAALCAVTAFTAGCASTPPRFYTLNPIAPAAAGQAPKPSTLSVLVGPVSIPVILDQPQIVINLGPNQVSFDEFNRWAAPLSDEIPRVVGHDLMAMLGTQRVTLSQQSLNANADYRVVIDIQGFESSPGEAASLNAAWSVRSTRDGKTETGRTSVREAAGGAGFEALAAAHSRALARMSQDIASVIRTLQGAAP